MQSWGLARPGEEILEEGKWLSFLRDFFFPRGKPGHHPALIKPPWSQIQQHHYFLKGYLKRTTDARDSRRLHGSTDWILESESCLGSRKRGLWTAAVCMALPVTGSLDCWSVLVEYVLKHPLGSLLALGPWFLTWDCNPWRSECLRCDSHKEEKDKKLKGHIALLECSVLWRPCWYLTL